MGYVTIKITRIESKICLCQQFDNGYIAFNIQPQDKWKNNRCSLICPHCGRESEGQLRDIRNRLASKHCRHCKRTGYDPDALRRSRLYFIYRGMLQRCNNPKSTSYKYYGAKGIKVEFKDYQEFKEWSLVNGYTDELTIDRINSDDNYRPNNCQWITLSENSKRVDRRKHHNIDEISEALEAFSTGAFTATELSKSLGISRDMFLYYAKEADIVKPSVDNIKVIYVPQ